MPSRAFAVSIRFGAVSLWALLPLTVPAGADEKPSSPTKAGLASDLSQFPKLQGQVKHVVGHVGSFVPPEAGESLQLKLKDVTKLTSLPFDPAKKSYIPLPGPVVVESMHYYSNGAFQSMRLVSKKGHSSVTIDVSPKPGLGPKRVLVWVIVQSEVVEGVALIDCEYEGAFPDRAKLPKQEAGLTMRWCDHEVTDLTSAWSLIDTVPHSARGFHPQRASLGRARLEACGTT